MTQIDGISLSNEVTLKVEYGEHEIKLVCAQNCPLGKLWDALAAFQGEVLRQIDANTPKQEGESEECQEKDRSCEQEASEEESDSQQPKPN